MATGVTRGVARAPFNAGTAAAATATVSPRFGVSSPASSPTLSLSPPAVPAVPAVPGVAGVGARQPEMAPEQLWQALQDIRTQAAQNPERVATLLMTNQQLALALAGALAVFGVLASNTPQLIIEARQAQAQAFQQQQQQQQQFVPMAACGALPVAVPVQQQHQQQGGGERLSAEAMEAMVEQLKHLTDEQVMELSPELRDMVRQLHQ